MSPHLVLLPSLSLCWARAGDSSPEVGGHTKASAVPIEVNLASVAHTCQSAAEAFKPQSTDLLELMIHHVMLQACKKCHVMD